MLVLALVRVWGRAWLPISRHCQAMEVAAHTPGFPTCLGTSAIESVCSRIAADAQLWTLAQRMASQFLRKQTVLEGSRREPIRRLITDT